jgi:hypothetical protein
MFKLYNFVCDEVFGKLCRSQIPVHLGVRPIGISLDISGYLWISLDISGYLLDIFWHNWISFRHIQEKISTDDIQEISTRYPDISKQHIHERYPCILIQ